MRRKIIMGMLAVGAVAGFGSGFSHMHHRHHHRATRAAEICVDAALATAEGRAPAPTADAYHHERRIAELCRDAALRRGSPGQTG